MLRRPRKFRSETDVLPQGAGAPHQGTPLHCRTLPTASVHGELCRSPTAGLERLSQLRARVDAVSMKQGAYEVPPIIRSMAVHGLGVEQPPLVPSLVGIGAPQQHGKQRRHVAVPGCPIQCCSMKRVFGVNRHSDIDETQGHISTTMSGSAHQWRLTAVIFNGRVGRVQQQLIDDAQISASRGFMKGGVLPGRDLPGADPRNADIEPIRRCAGSKRVSDHLRLRALHTFQQQLRRVGARDEDQRHDSAQHEPDGAAYPQGRLRGWIALNGAQRARNGSDEPPRGGRDSGEPASILLSPEPAGSLPQQGTERVGAGTHRL